MDLERAVKRRWCQFKLMEGSAGAVEVVEGIAGRRSAGQTECSGVEGRLDCKHNSCPSSVKSVSRFLSCCCSFLFHRAKSCHTF